MGVRAVEGVDQFVGLPGDHDDLAETVERVWSDGSSRPSWCFVLEHDSEPVGRIGYRVEETCPAEFLGDLPSHELIGFGLWLPWDTDRDVDLGRELLGTSLGRLGDVPEILEINVNTEDHDHAQRRVAVLREAGLQIFQEKQGYQWADDGTQIEVPDRLTFRSLPEVGRPLYRAVMSLSGEGTLDRNDRYYWSRAGAANWAGVMASFVEDDEAGLWLLGFNSHDDPVGYVAVSAFDEPETATIVHIGVSPSQRGNGYVDDLVLAGTAAAQQAGFEAMLSDVDVGNEPMRAAMLRAGHVEDARPWHHWSMRGPLEQVIRAWVG